MQFIRLTKIPALPLLAAAAAVAAWALWPKGDSGAGARLAQQEQLAGEDGPRFEIRGIALERDYGNARLEVEVVYENRRPSALTLQPPEVQLLAGSGEQQQEVADFFLAFQARERIAGRETGQAQLRFWLEAHHLQGPLVLRIEDHERTVKTAEPVDLESFDNRRKVQVRGGPWATR